MKTLKISSLAAVIACLSLFTACTKDLETSAAASQSYSGFNATSNTNRGNEMDDRYNTHDVDGKKIDLSTISISLSPEKVNINNDVTVTGSITAPEKLMYGTFTFERAALIDAKGELVKYVAAEEADLNDNDLYIWMPVKEVITNVTSASYTTDGVNHIYDVSFTYKVIEKGTFGWRLLYKSTRGETGHAVSKPKNLEVIDCVKELTIKPTVTAENIGEGNYEFTVTCSLTSPVDLENIKFQGGATSGGQFEHKMGAMNGLQVLHKNNQNTVLYFTGSLKACTPLELSFTYIRKFSCPAIAAAVTGAWTLESNNVEVAKVAPLVYTCN